MKLYIQNGKRGNFYVPFFCSLSANDGVASLIAWLEHSRKKLKIGVSKGMLFLKFLIMSPHDKKITNISRPWHLFNWHGVQGALGLGPNVVE